MTQARQLSLFITIFLWAIICGGIMYSHIVYFPPYLSHLPESNSLIRGEYGLHDENFWLLIHPSAIVSTIVTLVLNWKLKTRRKFIFTTLCIYVLVIIATANYFLPNLWAFAQSDKNTMVTQAEWFQKGQTWQHWSWIRGTFMYVGFLLILLALTKDNPASNNSYK
jgi:hypothetical protein